MIVCIHIRDAKPGDYYCGRASSLHKCPKGMHNFSELGNPFSAGSRGENINWYRNMMIMFRYSNHRETITFWQHMEKLTCAAQKGDIRLVCWCKPKACHTDIIKEVIESEIEKRNGG